MMPRSRFPRVALLVLAAMSFAAIAHAHDPITWSSLDCGGVSFVSSGGYRLGGTIGQPDAGVMSAGAFTLRGGFWSGGRAPVLAVENDAGIVREFRVYPVTPNPARARYRLAFDLPRASRVAVSMFDISGRVVHHRELGLLPAGHQSGTWDAIDRDGRPLTSGVYFVRLDTDHEHGVRRLVMLR